MAREGRSGRRSLCALCARPRHGGERGARSRRSDSRRRPLSPRRGERPCAGGIALRAGPRGRQRRQARFHRRAALAAGGAQRRHSRGCARHGRHDGAHASLARQGSQRADRAERLRLVLECRQRRRRLGAVQARQRLSWRCGHDARLRPGDLAGTAAPRGRDCPRPSIRWGCFCSAIRLAPPIRSKA